MKSMTPELCTERLRLRPVELADAEQVQPLFGQWEVVKYLNTRVPWPYPADGALTFFRDVALPAIERGDAWHWTLRLRSVPETVIGAISLMRNPDENRGFWLAPQWRGQGLMLEAADAVTDFWFRELKFPVMRIPKAAVNEASRRISLAQGMKVVKTFESDYVGGRWETELWELTSEEWFRHKAKTSTT